MECLQLKVLIGLYYQLMYFSFNVVTGLNLLSCVHVYESVYIIHTIENKLSSLLISHLFAGENKKCNKNVFILFYIKR
jgi:hypothetical protein